MAAAIFFVSGGPLVGALFFCAPTGGGVLCGGVFGGLHKKTRAFLLFSA